MLTECDFEPVLPSEMPVCDICHTGCLDDAIFYRANTGAADCDDTNIGGLIFCDSCRKAEIARTLKEVTPPALQQCTVTGDGIEIKAHADVIQIWDIYGEPVEVYVQQDGNTWTVTPVDPSVSFDDPNVTLEYNAMSQDESTDQ
jgi:hypothetical protein